MYGDCHTVTVMVPAALVDTNWMAAVSHVKHALSDVFGWD
jgi:hypothetical protein